MKICYINFDFYPYRTSGQVKYAEDVCFGMAKNHEVTVITSSKENRLQKEKIKNLKIIRIPNGKLFSLNWIGFGFRVAKFLQKLDKKENFDIIHFLDAHVAFAFRGKFIVTAHQSFWQRLTANGGIPYFSSYKNLFFRLFYYYFSTNLERLAVKKAQKIICDSNSTKFDFRRRYHLDNRKVEVINNGIDTAFFSRKKVISLRKKLGIKKNEKIILYVGFSTPRKGVEYLAAAFKNLNIKARLIMVGKWEEGYKERFLKQLGDKKADMIDVGYVNDEELPFYYSLADVFVLPSLLEGFGYPLAEAMACGTPVIGCAVGSIPEVIGDNGILVEPRDPDAILKAIEKILKNRSLYNPKKMREEVISKFDKESMLLNLNNVYTSYNKHKDKYFK